MVRADLYKNYEDRNDLEGVIKITQLISYEPQKGGHAAFWWRVTP